MFKSLEINTAVKEKLSRPIPQSVVLERDAGKGTTLSYISGNTVIDMLNSAFGYMWTWEVKKTWKEVSEDKFNKWSKIPEAEKVTYNGQKGAWEAQGPVVHCVGTLTVNLVDKDGRMIEIKKDGCGSKTVIGGQSEQDSIFKSAETDALKRAARLFGIGLELYRNEEENEHFNQITYEDMWTEELINNFSEEFAIINEYQRAYGLSDEELNSQIEESVGTPYLTPVNIKAVAKVITESIDNDVLDGDIEE